MSPARFHCAIPVIYIVKKKRRINLIEEQLEMYDHKESVKINRIVRGCIMKKNETERWLYGSFRVTDRISTRYMVRIKKPREKMRKTKLKHNCRKNGPAKQAKERSERAKSKNRRRMKEW